MHLKTRTVSAVVTMAVTASLAVAPALLQPTAAAAAPAAPARSSVTAECAAAQSSLASARTSKARAHKALVKARKALRSAKRSHRHTRIVKAKRVLAKARHRYAVRSQNVNTANKAMAYACSAPTSATRANATGQQLDLLAMGTGGLTDLINLSQLTTLLDRLLPGASGILSPAQLTALLSGFNTSPLGLADATALLGGSFTPAQLQSLLDGTASPALLLELANHIIGQLSGLTGGAVPVPGAFDPTALLQTIAGMFGNLDPSQLGGLLDLLLAGVGQPGATLDSAKLTGLINGLIPGVSTLLDPTQLTAMLGAVNGGSLDAGTLSNLLGGQFSAAQLQQVLAGTASPDLLAQVLASVSAQVGTIGGGDLALPGTLDPSVVTGLISTVTGLVTGLLGGGGGGGGGVLCTLLPILC
jgi:hypothetical protein